MNEMIEYAAFLRLNMEAGDTWATVSFEDWRRHIKHNGNQTYWGDFVKWRDAALTPASEAIHPGPVSRLVE